MAEATKRPSADDTQACTIFTVTRSDKVLFANNVDPKLQDGTGSFYWVSPADEARYSGLFLGKYDSGRW